MAHSRDPLPRFRSRPARPRSEHGRNSHRGHRVRIAGERLLLGEGADHGQTCGGRSFRFRSAHDRLHRSGRSHRKGLVHGQGLQDRRPHQPDPPAGARRRDPGDGSVLRPRRRPGGPGPDGGGELQLRLRHHDRRAHLGEGRLGRARQLTVSPTRFVLILAALSAGAALFLRPPRLLASGRWGSDYFPNVPLITQDGKVVHFYEDLLRGKKVAVNLVYTRCTASCPLETAKLAQVQRLLGDRVGKDIFFYSISIDPDHDTPATLKAYAEKFHTSPGWLFLTGNEDDIKLVSKKLGLSSLTDSANRDGHQPSLMIGNEPTGEWMRNSAVDNPRFLATTLTHFFGNGKGAATPAKSYADAPAMPDIGSGGFLFPCRRAARHPPRGGPPGGPPPARRPPRRARARPLRAGPPPPPPAA